MTIQAIETVYNNYRFRSRLEARWAVFFDAMQIAYDYESQGFVLGNGKRYLPDFYLKSQFCYTEVKPDNDDAVNQADETLTNFVATTRQRAMLLVGQPIELRAVLYEWCWNTMQVTRDVVDWSRATNFNQAAIAARQARFEYGEHGGK